jgi:hypothetical protein
MRSEPSAKRNDANCGSESADGGDLICDRTTAGDAARSEEPTEEIKRPASDGPHTGQRLLARREGTSNDCTRRTIIAASLKLDLGQRLLT